MSQQIAMIIHEIMDSPHLWRDNDKGGVTNGYYTVKMDGTGYGMGASSYPVEGSQTDILLRTANAWKEETGWKPKVAIEEKSKTPVSLPTNYVQSAHEEFAKSVRSNLRSFTVHSDPHVLTSGLQKALEKLDSIIMPMERIEGKKSTIS